VLRTGQDNVNEEEITDSDGSVRTIVTKKTLYESSASEPYIVGVIRDITDRKRVEEQVRTLNSELEQRVAERTRELARANRYLDEIIDSIADPLFVKDRQHRWVLLNTAFCEFVRRSRDELVGRSDYDLFPRSQADAFWTQDELVFGSGEECIAEEEMTDADGVVHTTVTKKIRYTDEAGEQRIVGIFRDVTEQKKLEAQLRQAQKMESVGLLAGGIAHDFNNVLTPILGNAELLLSELGPGRQTELARQIRLAADRASELTRQLLAFGRKQILELTTLDIAEVVARFEPMLRRTIREDIGIEIVMAPDLGAVRADRGQIEQILLNLAINGQDAMPRGGTLAIEAQNAELDEAYLTEHPEVRPGPYVMIAVSDTGTGMDRVTQDRLFEPFFTTKERGKGTGLGLSMVYGIVKQHGGSISVYSELGRGSTFRIYLPRLQQATGTTRVEQRPHRTGTPVRGGQTILVVEDNGMVRTTASDMLRRLGFLVLEAGSPEECFRVAETHAGPIDLLLTDVILQTSNGKEVFQRLRSARPSLKVLYMSGYTSNVIVHHGVVDEGVHFISKPLSFQLLSQKVREVLDLE
jgi:PAS domain S-box-containing protein